MAFAQIKPRTFNDLNTGSPRASMASSGSFDCLLGLGAWWQEHHMWVRCRTMIHMVLFESRESVRLVERQLLRDVLSPIRALENQQVLVPPCPSCMKWCVLSCPLILVILYGHLLGYNISILSISQVPDAYHWWSTLSSSHYWDRWPSQVRLVVAVNDRCQMHITSGEPCLLRIIKIDDVVDQMRVRIWSPHSNSK